MTSAAVAMIASSENLASHRWAGLDGTVGSRSGTGRP